MLDFRMDTFLAVCRHRNYTRAAEELNITQPAVTQHIQYLQSYYGVKLFSYQNKRLALTEEGELLRNAALCMLHDEEKLKRDVKDLRLGRRSIRFGATLTIGEYLLPERLAALDGQVFLDETEDTYCVWRAEYEKRGRICSYFMDIFRLDPGSGLWERGEELHRERAYEPEELTAFLREAGFRDIRQYGNLKLRPPREGEDRIFFVARKDPNMTGQV